MIKQAPVQADDQITPSIQDIRQRITQAVDKTKDSAVEHLKTWLQMPKDSTFTIAMDLNCQGRAKNVGTLLSSEEGWYQPPSLAAPTGVPGRWKTIGEQLKSGRSVLIEGASPHVCGEKSCFVLKNGTGFHVLVFLAVGTDSHGSPFYLGFDPDISATDASRARWGELAPAQIDALDDTAEGIRIIKAMVVGESQDGFGPLIRKYYVDTNKAFPPINRHF